MGTPRGTFVSTWKILATAIVILLAPRAAGAAENDKILLYLQWFHQFQFAGYYTALEKGFYRNTGLDVTIVEGGPGVETFALVESDIGRYGTGHAAGFLQQRAMGRHIVALASIFQHSPNAILVRADRGIENIHHLKPGRTVIWPGGHVEISAMFLGEGMDPTPYLRKPEGNHLKDLIAGKIDAIDGYVTNEVFKIEQSGVPLKIISPANYGVDFYGDILITSESEIQDYPKRVAAFKAASLQGWDYALNHQEEIVKFISEKYTPDKSLDALGFEAQAIFKLVKPGLVEIGHMNSGRWKRIANTLGKVGVIKSPIDVIGALYDPARIEREQRQKTQTIVIWSAIFGAVFLLVFGGIGWIFTLRRTVSKTTSALGSSERKFRNLVETSQDMIWRVDEEGRFTYLNPVWKETLGYDLEEMLGHTFTEFKNPAEAVRTLKVFKEVLSGATVTNSETTYISKKGQKLTLIFKAKPMFDSSGEIVGTQGTAHDITERKLADEALLENEKKLLDRTEMLQMAEQVARIGHWRFVVKTGEIFLSNEIYRIYGVEVGTDFPIEEGFKFYHPDDRKQVQDAFLKAIEVGEAYELDVRIVQPSGEIRHVRTKGQVLNDDDGTVQAVFGTLQDHTKRKEAEDKLLESEVKYRNLVEGSIQGIAIIQNLELMFANTALAEIYGFSSLDEIIGKNTLDLFIAPFEKERIKALHLKRMKGGEVPNRYEFQGCRVDGTLIWLEGLTKFVEWNGSPAAQVTYIDITERKKAEEAQRKNERLLQTVFDTIPHTVFVRDLNSKYLMINRAGTERYNLSPDDFKGVHILDMPIGTSIEKQGFLELDRMVFETGKEIEKFDYPVSQVDGIERYFNSIIFPLYGDDGEIVGLVGIAEDITDRKEAEEELARHQMLLKSFLDNSPNTIILKDLEGKYLFANKRWKEWFGIPMEDVNGKTAYDFFSKEFADEISAQDKKTIEMQEITEQEMKMTLANKTQITTYNVKFPVVDKNGRITGVGTISTDISKLSQLENQLRQAQKMEAIGTLAGGIAHDFNNILQPILLFSDLLRAEIPVDSQGVDYLEQITHAGLRAKDLVSKILLYSRQGDPEKTPTDIGKVAKEVVGLMISTFPKSVRLNAAIPDDLPLVLCDSTQFHQVLLNLCINGWQAIVGQGSLRVELSDVVVEGVSCISGKRLEGKMVRIAISDTGTGMDEETVAKIFDPFFTTKGVGEGTGMGLSSALGIIQNIGGGIVVSSELGKGTIFEIFLPVHEGEIKESVISQAASGGTESILVVDDEEAIARGLSITLEMSGYDVTAISDSNEAFKIFKENPDRFALVITDQSMPNMNGDILIKKMRKLNSKIPVILCSGLPDGVSSETMNSIGINAILGKPLDKLELEKSIREVLEASREVVN